ncbi:TPA: hypothetical protein ACT5CK_002438 [Flavobacterium psychrophilum]|uniref:hypothetical protein n=1 Tax=Flavobacterium psychrophilum TaxID=96345 RepID=UPI00073E20F5|nr:hypothetical protein [Flavobacterium psychrophilum]GAQ50188.1 hypothetical protein FPK15_contig00136-0003 [Flavobacterium psychrophilum]GAW90803.1 hypothetical protein FPS14_contig00127-0001 [Flavobacterium psychrophilum]GEJ34735.1 hypothetical protein FPN181_contig00119-0001 [Flavobacterium psychrophilum]GEJ35365.1 hypothetical protein FPN185_contig00134-0001 [Flavobacterium psychrophilum]GEJ38527.1 hypothetical protein FPN186_contig00019-0003 [Flavobacterium psychrophilum]
MKGFIRITEADNRGGFLNISTIVKFYRKTQDAFGIDTVDGKSIECKQTLEEIEKLINDASTL